MAISQPNPVRRAGNQNELDHIGAELGAEIARHYRSNGPSRAYRAPAVAGTTPVDDLRYGLAEAMNLSIDTMLWRGRRDPAKHAVLDRFDELLAMHHIDDLAHSGRSDAGRPRKTYSSPTDYFSEAFEAMANLVAEVSWAAPIVLAREYDGRLSPRLLFEAVRRSAVFSQVAGAASVNMPLVMPALRRDAGGQRNQSVPADQLTVTWQDGIPVIGLKRSVGLLEVKPGITLRQLLQEQNRPPGGEHRRCPGVLGAGLETCLPTAATASCREQFWVADLRPGGRLERLGYDLNEKVETTRINLYELDTGAAL